MANMKDLEISLLNKGLNEKIELKPEDLEQLLCVRTPVTSLLYKAIMKLVHTEMNIAELYYKNKITEQQYKDAIELMDGYRKAIQDNIYTTIKEFEVKTIDPYDYDKCAVCCDNLRDLINANANIHNEENNA